MQRASIIIPFQQVNDYLSETLRHLVHLDWADFEVVLLPDYDLPELWLEAFASGPLKLLVQPTGPVSPAIKRDLGAQICTGDILAFIDDDAYPPPDWLNKLVPHFDDLQVCAVGGPQITPESDSFWQKVSGAMFVSPLNGAAAKRYFAHEGVYETDDWPSVNLLVRKSDFLAVGGFDNAYWPGEDTKLCADLVKTGKKILADGSAPVFHHRRSGFYRHLRQVGNYGEHRGYFAKIEPSTSLKPGYMAPSAFLLFVLCGWAACLLPSPWPELYLAGWSLYGLALIWHVIGVWQRCGSLVISLNTLPYLIGTHLVYGYRFIKGLSTGKDFTSKLGR